MNKNGAKPKYLITIGDTDYTIRQLSELTGITQDKLHSWHWRGFMDEMKETIKKRMDENHARNNNPKR